MAKYKDLDGLLWQVMKTSPQPAVVQRQVKPEVRLGFDADRFRWYFKGRDGKSLQEWRDLIDMEMMNANSEHPTSS